MTKINSFLDMEIDPFDIPIIVIYDSPSDFKGKFVGRLFIGEATEFHVVKDTLSEVRNAVPDSFFRMERSEQDDPVIVEVWI